MPNIDDKITFGIELEGVTASSSSTRIAAMHGFTLRYDHSIVSDSGQHLPTTVEAGGGFEFITRPIAVGIRMSNTGDNLVMSPESFETARRIVADLCSCVDHVNTSCGVHIHLGRPTSADVNVSKWEPERVRTMLAIGLMIENKIFSVLPESRNNNDHCARINRRYTQDDLGQFYPVGTVAARKYDNAKRYCWLNLIETRRVGTESRPGRGASMATGTIEIRALGNTNSFEYVFAWTKLWLKIAAYVAYLPSSLAMMRCCMMDNFADEFSVLTKCKSETIESNIVIEPPRIDQMARQPRRSH